MILHPHQLMSQPVTEAVTHALQLQPVPWMILDRALRMAVVRFLQDREGDAAAVMDALGRAADGARAAREATWDDRWCYLAEILRDGTEHPALAAELKLLEPSSRAAEVLKTIATLGPPVQRTALKASISLSDSRLSDLLGTLEKGGLIQREDAGRNVWILLTPRGRSLLRLLPTTIAAPIAAPPPTAAPQIFWQGDMVQPAYSAN